jgi:hypothetical protein
MPSHRAHSAGLHALLLLVLLNSAFTGITPCTPCVVRIVLVSNIPSFNIVSYAKCFSAAMPGPLIIILGETMSALNDRTDTLSQEVFRKRLLGTLIIVARHLRIIALFDWTVVIPEGIMAKQTKPKEL